MNCKRSTNKKPIDREQLNVTTPRSPGRQTKSNNSTLEPSVAGTKEATDLQSTLNFDKIEALLAERTETEMLRMNMKL